MALQSQSNMSSEIGNPGFIFQNKIVINIWIKNAISWNFHRVKLFGIDNHKGTTRILIQMMSKDPPQSTCDNCYLSVKLALIDQFFHNDTGSLQSPLLIYLTQRHRSISYSYLVSSLFLRLKYSLE